MRPLSLTKITTFWIYAYSLGKGLSYIMLLVIILSTEEINPDRVIGKA